ncbi:MAG: hypothetical protein KGY65_06000 [Candidatus Thermoplasmatota archaeon]|nr:hypothetical protein [Candidatus Thermoplasmatota archaeon]MBS3802285.1 hypothetical protein [Candidatus Thermoplasmatota archaeon]
MKQHQPKNMITYCFVSISILLLLTQPMVATEITENERRENIQIQHSELTDLSDTSSPMNQHLGYVIDQIQDKTNSHRYTASNWYLAQSFKPSKNPLAKIEILLELKTYEENQLTIEVAIRENLSLNNPPLTQKDITLSNADYDATWLEVKYDDVKLTLDDTYYITIHQVGSGDCYWYGNYEVDYYEKGFAYGYDLTQNKWQNLSNMPVFQKFDFCFKTFSYGDNLAPQITKITGPSLGKTKTPQQYTFSAEDPESENIYITIDWGDETPTKWLGPYQSNEEITLKHTWKNKGSYIIKAQSKDTAGNVGEWNTINAIMPNEKEHTLFFQRIIHLIQQFLL